MMSILLLFENIIIHEIKKNVVIFWCCIDTNEKLLIEYYTWQPLKSGLLAKPLM